MGTRNLSCVMLNGEYRVAQYGQWDGYPSGMGETIRRFLLCSNMERFRKQVAKIRDITEAQRNALWIDGEGFVEGAKHLSRDQGADILSYVMVSEDPFVFLQTEFAADSLFCEWAYVIDLDKKPLDPGERFASLPRHKKRDGTDSEYYPVRHVKTWKLDDIPADAMETLEAELNAKDEERA